MIKLITILIFLISISTSTSFSQYITWSGIHCESGMIVANDVIETPDSGFIAVGRQHLINNYMCIIRTNKYGEIIWTRSYPGSDFRSIQKTSDNNYIVCGSALILLKINLNGDTLWSKSPYNPLSLMSKIKETSDKGFILIGRVDSGIAHYPYLLKVDSLGRFQWDKIYSSLAQVIGYNVVQTAEGGYTFTGTDTIAIITNTDSLGNVIWSKRFPKNGDFTSIIYLQNDGYVLGGNGDGSYYVSYKPKIIKTDMLGNIVWTRTYYLAGNGWANCHALSTTSESGYCFTGTTDTAQNMTLYSYLVKTDSLGNIIFHKLYGLSESDAGWAVRNTSDNGYIIGGWGSINNHDCLELIKTDPSGDVYPIGIKKNNELIPKGFVLHQNYPNPFNPTTTIKFDIPSLSENKKGRIKITIFDILGREVVKLIDDE